MRKTQTYGVRVDKPSPRLGNLSVNLEIFFHEGYKVIIIVCNSPSICDLEDDCTRISGSADMAKSCNERRSCAPTVLCEI